MVGMLQAFSSCSPSHCLLRGKGVASHSGIETVEIVAFNSRSSAQTSCGLSRVVHAPVRMQPGNVKQGLHVGGEVREQRNAGRRRVTGRDTLGVTDKLDNQEKRTVKTVRIHYNRKDGDYEQWGLHVWGDAEYCTPWESPLVARGLDDFGSYWDVDCVEGGKVYFLIHTGREKEFEGIMDTAKSDSVWVVSEHPDVFMEKPDLDSIPKGDLGFARALWISENIIAVNFDGDCYSLHACKDANLTLTAAGVEGAREKIQLEEEIQGLPVKVVERFPYITGYKALRVPKGTDTRELVKCQLALSSSDSAGVPLDATGVQLPGVLDELFAYDGPLGVSITEENVSLSVWAPTAQTVRLILFHSPAGGEPFEVLQMNESDGVWSVQGPAEWKGKYYLYEVTVFHPSTRKVEKSLACDPYSRG